MSAPKPPSTPVWNRPGLPALSYRVGTHQQFLDAMSARLPLAGAKPPVPAVTTREPDDPSIALLDAWAVVADVLTFYQERIANEGFLRTATEQESLVRLGRLVGHLPRPALAAATHLAYTLDAGISCVVPAGSQVRSEPEPGGLPLVFETAKDLTARADWNRLPVRTTGSSALMAGLAVTTPSVEIEGVKAALRPGDRLLFTYRDARLNVTRVVGDAAPDPARGRTAVRLRVPDATRQLDSAVDALAEDVEETAGRAPSRGPFEELLALLREVRDRAEELRDPDTFAARLDRRLRRLRERLADLGGGADADALAKRATVRLATVRHAVRRMAEEPARPASAGAQALRRDLRSPGHPVLHTVDPLLRALDRSEPAPHTPPAVADALGAGSDGLPRLLAGNRPGLTASLYEALTAVSVPATTRWGVQRFRVTAVPLGASIPDDDRVRGLLRAAARSQPDGTAPLAADVLLLDAVHEEIEPGSWIAVGVVGRPRTRVVKVTEVGQLSVANGQDAVRVTRLRLAGPWTQDCDDIAARRATTVWAAGEPLVLAALPDPTDVKGDALTLDGTFEGLAPGRLLIVSGERTDVVPGPGPGVPGSELAVLAGVRHAFIDRVCTTLQLTAPLTHRYRRDTVVVHGNVVPATAGETVTEILGSGDSGRAGQVLPLRQSPLVWLPSTTAEGGEEALTVRVDDVAWQRTADLGEAGPAAHVFQLRAGPDGRAAVEFGDGLRGARLPSGTENVTARYRVGGGRAGNVAAGRISQVVSRPPGVSGVTNPLPATGGADADGPAQLYRAIPLRLAAFDRLVSVRDHQSFARAFAGVGKAVAQRCTDGGSPVLHVTVAAADDAPLTPSSSLLAGLRTALRRYGDPRLPVRVEPCERVRLVLALGVRTAPGHLPEKVEHRVREALAARLGFAEAHLARPVYLSAVVAAAQGVTGVDFVDVDAFGGIPEGADPAEVVKFAEHPSVASCVPALSAGPRAVRDLSPVGEPPDPAGVVDASQAPTVFLDRRAAPGPAGWRPPRLVLRPAQLVLLDPAVPGTLLLRRIP
ncbi:putative baseplate assembly protein [Streptomyces sp. MZ04]|uniref:putative baseplate assembly protein n=1 Tax=Streptomyces sp. MZ04 TaxID=2559236 RepID=UPI00107E98C1|nr:putative baseplate assembly protein [Streptomyces sp. MZ04]TGA88991.1 putative baseplate assembly protein [Streptomyces sp. MZ04]